MLRRTPIAELLDREAFTVALALVAVWLVLAPRSAAALTGMLALVLVPAVLLVLRRGRVESGAGTATLVVPLLASLVMAAGSLAASDVPASVWGFLGQHTGSLTWVALPVAFAVSALVTRPGDAGRVARAVGAVAAALAVAALLELMGLRFGARFSQQAAGLLENSLSLAQVLVVGLGCSVAWALGRKPGRRSTAVVCAALSAAGLGFTGSRAAWLGVVVGVVLVAAVVVLVKRRGIPAGALAAAIVSIAAVAVAGMLWMAVFAPPSSVKTAVAGASNQRATIWTSATAQAREHLALGKGPDQFTAWAVWTSTPGVDLSPTATTDPHNAALSWLLGAGIPGLLALIAAAFFALRGMLRTLLAYPGHLGTALITAGVVAFGVSVLFAWTSTVAALLAVVVAGALAGSVPKPEHAGPGAPSRRWAPLAAAGLVLVLALVAGLFWRSIGAEYAWARGLSTGSQDLRGLGRASLATGDPSLATIVVRLRIADAQVSREAAAAEVPAAEVLRPVLEKAATWHVDAAYQLEELAAARRLLLGEDTWARTTAALAAGKRADPSSGLWDYVGAVRALGEGKNTDAKRYAEEALRKPQPDEVRSWLSGIAAGTQK